MTEIKKQSESHKPPCFIAVEVCGILSLALQSPAVQLWQRQPRCVGSVSISVTVWPFVASCEWPLRPCLQHGVQDESTEHAAQPRSAQRRPPAPLPRHHGVAAWLGHCAAGPWARRVQGSLARPERLQFLCCVLWLCAVPGQVRLLLRAHKKLALMGKDERGYGDVRLSVVVTWASRMHVEIGEGLY